MKFERHEISVMYKKEPRDFELYSRPLWEWVLDQLQDPSLFPHTDLTAHQLFRYDGAEWKRFVNDPLSANRAWRVQVRLWFNPPKTCTLALNICILVEYSERRDSSLSHCVR